MTESWRPGFDVHEIAGQYGVVLRTLTPADAQRYFDLIDYDRSHFTVVGEPAGKHYTSVDKVLESFDDPGSRVRFGIWADEEMVGSINYTPRSEDVVRMGYWVGRQYAHRHHATNAARTLVDYLFGAGVRRIEASVRLDNKGSRKVLLGAGFGEIGMAREWPGYVRYALDNPQPTVLH